VLSPTAQVTFVNKTPVDVTFGAYCGAEPSTQKSVRVNGTTDPSNPLSQTVTFTTMNVRIVAAWQTSQAGAMLFPSNSNAHITTITLTDGGNFTVTLTPGGITVTY
jgi:hypothetical protein